MSKVTNKSAPATKKAVDTKKEAKKPVKPVIEDFSEESEEQTVPVNNKKVEKKNVKQNDVKPVKEVKKPAKEEAKTEPKKKETKKEAKPAKKPVIVDEDEDDVESEGSANELFDDDDIVIPSKKAKVAQNKEKVTKKTKEGEKPKNKKNKTGTSDADTANATDASIEASAEKKQKSKANRLSRKTKEADASQRGILYVGHLPHGFDEEGLRGYFKQYGDILNVHLARSKKTARSKGYAFIEFKFREVAKIAAESMNNYMLYGKMLTCRLIEDDEGLKVKTHKFKYIPHKLLFIEDKNREKSPVEIKREVRHLLKSEEKKRTKLAELGIDYDFPGFKAAVEQAK